MLGRCFFFGGSIVSCGGIWREGLVKEALVTDVFYNTDDIEGVRVAHHCEVRL